MDEEERADIRTMTRASQRDGESEMKEETVLIERVATGDLDEPMGALYDLYSSRLYGLGIRLLGDRGLAEELVQETFLRLWRSAPRFDRELGSGTTFIYTIARRVAIDLRRRRSSRPHAALVDVDRLGSEHTTPSHEGEVELAIGVREALDTLSSDQRAVLVLHYDHDLTQNQIAQQLGIPLGTVKTRTYHGLRALRRVLEEGSVHA